MNAANLSSVLLVATFAFACGGEPPVPEKVDVVPPSEEAGEEAVQAVLTPAPSGDAPVIACDEAEFDFGAINASDTVEHVFEIRNAGGADLKIERVQKT